MDTPREGQSQSRLNKKQARFLGGFLVTLGFILAIIAIGLAIHNSRIEPKPPPGAIQTAAKASVKPSAKSIADYTVPPTDPRYIAIPAIGIPNTPVLKLGLLQSGAIATPYSIYETGWYGASSRPGQNGAMFIYGHVSSWTEKGIFYNLKNLHAGDTIKVTRGDNTTYTYKVVSSKTYPYNKIDMHQVLSPVDASKPGLNLMTCAGQVVKGTSEFNERLVVFTSLVNS